MIVVRSKCNAHYQLVDRVNLETLSINSRQVISLFRLIELAVLIIKRYLKYHLHNKSNPNYKENVILAFKSF